MVKDARVVLVKTSFDKELFSGINCTNEGRFHEPFRLAKHLKVNELDCFGKPRFQVNLFSNPNRSYTKRPVLNTREKLNDRQV